MESESDRCPPLSRRWIAAFAVLALLLAVLVPRLRKTGELEVYLTGAQRLVGSEEIYRPTDFKAFTYPPFFALPFIPLTLLPPGMLRPAWWFCNLCLVGVITYLVTVLLWPAARQGRARGRPPIWVNAIVIGILSARYLLLPLTWESHDLIVLTLVLLSSYALARGHDVAAGCWAGFATACKATPLLLLPLLVWQRRMLAAAALVGTLVVATILPDLIFPASDGKLWVQHWHAQFLKKVSAGAAPAANGAWQAWNPLNQSFAGTFHRWFTPSANSGRTVHAAIAPLGIVPLRILTVAADLAALIWLAWMTRPACRMRTADGDRSFVFFGQTGAALCVMLLLSPMSSTYHFCALFVPIAFCATYWMYREQHPCVGWILMVHGAVSLGSAQDLVGRGMADRMQDYGVMTLDTVLLLFCSGFILGWRMPKSHLETSHEVRSAAPDITSSHQEKRSLAA